jgi:hypothetical protein
VNHLRLGLAIGGFVFALLGVVLIDGRLVGVAIAMLLGSLAFRLILRNRGSGNSTPEG